MAYEIRYDTIGAPSVQKKRYNKVLIGASVLLLVAGAMAVKSTWLPWVQDYLLPGDPAVTAAALEEMVEDLKEGQGIVSAFRAFCREILAHAS